jgi:hypothetical protein
MISATVSILKKLLILVLLCNTSTELLGTDFCYRDVLKTGQ